MKQIHDKMFLEDFVDDSAFVEYHRSMLHSKEEFNLIFAGKISDISRLTTRTDFPYPVLRNSAISSPNVKYCVIFETK